MSLVLWGAPALEIEERGRTHLYSLEYDEARRTFAELTDEAPLSPAGPYYQASTLWMQELTRRGGLAGATFRTARYWSRAHNEPPPPGLDAEFQRLVNQAAARADALLAQDPEDREALYFRGTVEGLRSAYLATIEHRYFRAYQAGKRAKRFHERLLELYPDDGDACLLPGIFEYTVATLPRGLKLVGFLFGLRGSKERGLALVERAVAHGKRSRAVAKLSLAVLRQREKRYRSALAILRELEAAYPKNPLLPLERGAVHMLRKDYRTAQRVFEEVRVAYEERRPNYERIEPALIRLRLAESFLFEKSYARAAQELEAALGIAGTPDPIKARIFLRRGMVSDAMGARSAARADYRRALRLDVDRVTNGLAKRYLARPYRQSKASGINSSGRRDRHSSLAAYERRDRLAP